MSRDDDALLKCVCLVRARLSGSAAAARAPVASLEPVVCLCASATTLPSQNQNKSMANNQHAMENGQRFWKEQPALQGALGIFSGNLLRRQHRQRQVSTHVASLYSCSSPTGTTTCGLVASPWTLLPVSEEGLYIQVPSGLYINACRKWLIAALSGKNGSTEADPVDSYMDSLRLYAANRAHSEEKHASTDAGTLYGYAFFLPEGITRGDDANALSSPHSKSPALSEESGLVLCLVSSSPVFNFMRTLTTQLVPVLCASARPVGVAATTGASKIDDTALFRLLYPLQELTNPRNAYRSTLPGQIIGLPLALPVGVEGPGLSSPYLGRSHGYILSLPRPYDVYHPFLDVPLSVLLLSFSYDALRVLHSLLIQERRILFIGMTPQHAAACAVSAPALIAPLVWVSPLISYLSPEHVLACDGLDALFAAPEERGKGRGLASLNSLPDGPRGAENGQSGGFIIGSTPGLVPALMLMMRCGAAPGVSSRARPEDAIWIADARTGNVSVMSPNAHPAEATIVLEVLPESDKLRSFMKKCVTSEGQLAFRTALETLAAYHVNHRAIHTTGGEALRLTQQLSRIGVSTSDWDQFSEAYEFLPISNCDSNIGSIRNWECEDNTSEAGSNLAGSPSRAASMAGGDWNRMVNSGPPIFPDIASTRLVEVHAAVLEHNAQLLLGNYRKGLRMNSCSPLVVSSGPSKAITAINSLDYIVGNLDMHNILATHICGTHHLKQFEHALVRVELLGLSSVLRGDYIRSTPDASTRNLTSREARAMVNRYVSDPRMVAMLNLFYEQSKRRFPDLFPDLLPIDGVMCCHRVATMALLDGAGRENAQGRAALLPSATPDPLIEILAGKISGDRNNRSEGSGSSGSGGGIRKFFAKATKAVRQSIAGGTSGQIVPISFPDFAQTFTSFTDLKGANGPSAVALWRKMAMAPLPRGVDDLASASSRADPPKEESSVLLQERWAHAVASQARETLTALEYALSDANTAAVDAMMGSGNALDSICRRPAASTGEGPDRDPLAAYGHCCQPLCLDLIHQLDRYQPLLNPEQAGAPRTRADAGTAAALATSLVQLLPTSRRVRLHAEALAERALRGRSPIPDPPRRASAVGEAAGPILDDWGEFTSGVPEGYAEGGWDTGAPVMPPGSFNAPSPYVGLPIVSLDPLDGSTAPMRTPVVSPGALDESIAHTGGDGRSFLSIVSSSRHSITSINVSTAPLSSAPRDTMQCEGRRAVGDLLDELFMEPPTG